MHRTLQTCLFGSLAFLALSSVAWAGTITAQGNVTALDDVTQITSVAGVALFDEGMSGDVPLDQYAGVGLTLHVDELNLILPGVMVGGSSINPIYVKPSDLFPSPVAGGGVSLGRAVFYAGAMTFSDPVTQFGLTAGNSSVQYITAWDQAGVLIGQVTWEPEEDDAAFVGIDTMGTPIALLVYGNDDLFNGEDYSINGPGSSSDTWVWGLGVPCQTAADCLDDTGPCTDFECNNGVCAYPATTNPCDDLDACTDVDTCAEGMCVGAAISCVDTNACTLDTCDAEIGCENKPIEDCCLSDEDCPEGDMCLVGSNTCIPGPPEPPMTTDDGGGDETETGEPPAETGSDETGPAVDGGDTGCGCSSDERGGGALFGLLFLALLGTTRTRRREHVDL